MLERKSDWGFILALFVAIFLFFPEMFFLKLSFVSGDHRAQHYPWAVFYAEGLKQFQLPWWTTQFHSGFPLLAEGQVGAFYPLNVLFYFFLPPFFAYTYEILTHYLLAAVFFYVYLRSLELSPWSVFFGTLIYLFGTAQGGYFYNIISQKVLIWLPLTFYLSDQIVEKGKRSFAAWLGLILAFQLFGGYLQYAVYSIGFTAFYFLWGATSRLKERGWGFWVSNLGWLGASLGLAGLLSAPQLLSTWELAGFSNRFSFTEEFAYVGSMNPLAVATLFFPHWDGFLRSEIYVGVLGLFFVLVSACTKKLRKEWFFVVMSLAALGLALGKFNPLFVGLIKATRFYGFRTPSKFLFFLAVGLSVLAAFGFEKWIYGEGKVRRAVVASTGFTILCFLGLLGLFVSNPALRAFASPIKERAAAYIVSHFAGSPLHPLPASAYLAKFEGVYASVLKATSLFQPWNLAFAGFILASWLLIRSRFAFSRPFLVALLFTNLYLYGFTSVKGNYEAYAFLEPNSRVLEYLKGEKGIFRIHRAPSTLASTETLLPLLHGNMLYDLELTGGYSPFVLKEYYELLRGIGDVNDSQRYLLASKDALVEQSSLLDFLNVKYLVTDYPLDQTEYVERAREKKGYLYENQDFLPRAFFVTRAESMTSAEFLEEVRTGRFTPTRRVYLIGEKAHLSQAAAEPPEEFKAAEKVAYKQQEVTVELEAPGAGYLVMSDLYYPGWKVSLNGEASTLLKANGVFRAVKLPQAGKYVIRFFYDPLWKKLVPVTFGGSLAAALIPWIAFSWRRRK